MTKLTNSPAFMKYLDLAYDKEFAMHTFYPAKDDFSHFPESSAYIVRQYRPAYFSGFDTEYYHASSRTDVLNAPWLGNFKGDHHDKDGGFKEFVVEPYTKDELIISAHYNSGAHWVAGFAITSGHRFKGDWRYGGTEGNVK